MMMTMALGESALENRKSRKASAGWWLSWMDGGGLRRGMRRRMNIPNEYLQCQVRWAPSPISRCQQRGMEVWSMCIAFAPSFFLIPSFLRRPSLPPWSGLFWSVLVCQSDSGCCPGRFVLKLEHVFLIGQLGILGD